MTVDELQLGKQGGAEPLPAKPVAQIHVFVVKPKARVHAPGPEKLGAPHQEWHEP